MFFNAKYPPDKELLGRAGRYGIVKGSFLRGDKAVCRYGVYMPGNELAPLIKDSGIELSADELRELAATLSNLVEAGEIKDEKPVSEYNAVIESKNAEQKRVYRERLLW